MVMTELHNRWLETTLQSIERTLQRLMDDKRFRIAAAAAWVVVVTLSLSLVWASKRPIRTATQSMAATLPAAPLNIPILDRLPAQAPRKSATSGWEFSALDLSTSGGRPSARRELAAAPRGRAQWARASARRGY